MQTYPGLLFHPNIPKPLHTMAPRIFLGTDWWNDTKQKSKSKLNQHCWACGVHKSEAKYHQWLEAHECYSMNYSTGQVEYVGTSALCHSCHNYIHNGRLKILTQKGEISHQKESDILAHGDAILKAFLESKGIKWIGGKLDGYSSLLEIYPMAETINRNIQWIGEGAEWEEYHMVINGVVYPRQFNTFQDWLNHWS